MATSAMLVLRIVADAKSAQAGLEKTAKSTSKLKSGVGTASKVAAGGLLALGAAAISAGNAAAEDERSQAVLAQTMRNNAAATDAAVMSTEAFIAGLASATGVADEELRPALGSLVRATGDVEKSQDALKVAMDVSAATGKPLEAVSAAIAKGFGGSTGALSKLVPGLDKATLKSKNMTAIMAELADKTGGSAAKAAETAAGKMAIARNSMEEATESIGAGLLPVLGKLGGLLTKVGDFAQKHSTTFQAFVVVLGAIALAVVVLNVAMTVYTVITTLAASATVAAWAAALWPITLVIAAIGLVVLVVVLLWKKCETFRTVVLAVWSAIKTGAAAVVAFLKPVFKVAFAALILYVKLYWLVISSVFKLIKALVVAVASWVAEKWRAIWGPIKTAAKAFGAALAAVWAAIRGPVLAVTGWIKSKWTAMVSAIKAAAAGLGEKLAAPFNFLKDAVTDVIGYVDKLLDKIRAVKLPKINIPGFGKSANATVTTRGTLPPLGRSTASRAATSGSTGNTFIFNGVIDAPDAARRIRALMRDDDRRRRGVQITGSGGRSWQPA